MGDPKTGQETSSQAIDILVLLAETNAKLLRKGVFPLQVTKKLLQRK